MLERKAYLIKKFGEKEYESFIPIDFYEHPELKTIFDGELTSEAIYKRISANIPNIQLIPGNTLIFLDEIQRCGNARTAIKFLAEDFRFDVISSGSLLRLSYGMDADDEVEEVESIPVGYEMQLTMHSLDFEEFLELILCKKNTVVPELVFASLTTNTAPSLHLHLGNGVAVNFINDARLINQKAVDLNYTITAPKGYATRIAFKSEDKLSALTSIHATVPKAVKSVNVYRVDKAGKRTLLGANIPVADGRYCFLIDQLGVFEIEY